MNRLIRLSVENTTFVYLMVLLILLFGWFSYQSLPIDAIPDITNVQVQINTNVGALSPDTAESSVTYPIESVMGAIPGAQTIRSITRFGISQVTVVFKEGTDIYLARQMVTEKLQSIDLPEAVQPELGPISTGLGEIYFYTLEAKKIESNPKKRLKQLMELRTIQEWQIKPRLLLVEGVAEVNSIGGYPKEIYVKPKLSKLSNYGLDFESIVTALRKNGFNTGGANIEQTAEQILVQGSGLYRSIKDIKQVPITQLQNFDTISIEDIADVDYEKKIRTGAATYNGEEGIICTVFMLLGENSRTVSISIDEKVNELQNSLPEWVELKTIYNRSELVNATINTVIHNLLFGAILVAIILLLLVGNFRAVLITAFTIPLALLATLIGMNLAGISGNLMSLGALDFGIIIDGAVIVVDNCARAVRNRANKKKKTLTREEIKATIIESTSEIRRVAGFGQLIIAIVFLPIMALTGIEGKMFKPMASAFFFALIAAFILAFTIVPALAGAFLSGKPNKLNKTDETFLMKWISRLYTPILKFALKRKLYLICSALVLLVGGILVFFRMGSEFIPKLYEGSIAVQFVRPVNISLTQSVKLQKISERKIKEFAEVESVFARIGTAEIATDPMGVNLADTYIMLKPESQWPKIEGKRRDKDELRKAISTKLQKRIPGQRILMTQPIEMRFNELLEGVRGDISLKIFGDDLSILEKKSLEVVKILRGIEGIGEVESELQGTSPLLSITPKMSVLKQYGIAKASVLNTVEAAIGGELSGHMYEGVIKYPIVVRLEDRLRESTTALKRIPVSVGQNFTVPISDLANFNYKEIYGTIKRETSQRRVAVLINLDGRDTQSFVEEARKQVAKQVKLPAGYYLEWGGSFKNLRSAKKRLMFLAPMILLVVIFMIYSAFRNWMQTGLILLGIPFALAGGIAGLLFMGLPFSVSASVGFIALSGVAVLNGIVLIGFLNQLKIAGETGTKLIVQGTSLRLRAVMMTALTDILGFLPMMLATGMGAEVQRPLATVVVSGIFTSTVLTLIILPILYNLLEKKMKVKENQVAH